MDEAIEIGQPTLRLVNEKNELEERIRNLRGFPTTARYKAMMPYDQSLIRQQLRVMNEYRDILAERLLIIQNESG
jgi:hypothetical protein